VATLLHEHRLPDGRVVRVVQGDLTAERVDAIVNAANEELAHGGGVASAIVRRGGTVIQDASDRWVAAHGFVATGTAAITGAGALPARHVIHAVGPVWQDRGDEPALLASAGRAALEVAAAHGCRSVALPAISSGIFGFPKPLCAEVILDASHGWLADHPAASVREVRCCNVDDATAQLFAAAAAARSAGA
jgi:putative ATPase